MPSLARSMLANSVRGPLNVKVPNEEDYFYSFLYHILFHKGFFAGVKSENFSDLIQSSPENDYAAFSKALALRVGLDFDPSLESAEAILAEKGFVPKLDTLAAIARVNKWVNLRYFGANYITEVGLSVLILKEIAHENNWVTDIERDMQSQDFDVLEHKVFSDEEVAELSATLRGGNWYVSRDNKSDYLPRSAYVLLDRKQGKAVKAAAGKRESRIRLLKTALRQKYDNSLDSFIHATDDTAQSWEYIDDIWPSARDQIERKVSALSSVKESKQKPAFFQIETKLHVLRERIKQKILAYFE